MGNFLNISGIKEKIAIPGIIPVANPICGFLVSQEKIKLFYKTYFPLPGFCWIFGILG